MKNKYIIALFLLGVVVTTIGAFFKIAHLEIDPFTGSLIIMLGVFIKVVAAILFITKLLSYKNNDFLNK